MSSLPHDNEEYGSKDYWQEKGVNHGHHGPSDRSLSPGIADTRSTMVNFHHSFTPQTHSSRESGNGSFDWFKSYSDISYIIHEFIPNKSARILMLGCGNSRLSEEVSYPCHHQISTSRYHTHMQMYDDGYKSITNVDVRHLHCTPLPRLTVSCSVLFRGHPPNATTPQHLATGDGMLVVVCPYAQSLFVP